MGRPPEAGGGSLWGSIAVPACLARGPLGCVGPCLPELSDGLWPSLCCQAELSHVPCLLTHEVHAGTVLLIHSLAS